MAVQEDTLIHKISVYYKEDRLLECRNISLSPGTVSALVGSSGSGKTLTALALLNLIPFAAPGLKAEADITFPTPANGFRLSYVPQGTGFHLQPTVSVRAQIRDLVCGKGGFSPETYSEKEAFQLLRRMRFRNPEKLITFTPLELSGGMLQRVLLAIALYLRKYKKIADLFRLVIRMLPPLLFLFGIVAWARENPFGEILSLFSLSFIFAWPVFSAELELTLKQPYIEGTKALGASSFYILKNVTTPNVLPNLIKYARLDFASLIAFEAFLGMGGLNKPPHPSLGALIFESRYAIISNQAWLFIFPSMMLGCILLTVYFFPNFFKLKR
jgi:ABC-type lipoprotein export system ATPase subunit